MSKGTAYVSRFRRSVSLTLPMPETNYLSVEEAKDLAAAIMRAALDVERQGDYTKSTLETYSVLLNDA